MCSRSGVVEHPKMSLKSFLKQFLCYFAKFEGNRQPTKIFSPRFEKYGKNKKNVGYKR